ncbi:MAG TPA: TolC family protein [Dokdonella sp.]|uniref:TolC family protein n=1 Tax=Dokdonella sp. TaxID=2291710 RepID=UPI002D80CE00|nr:TolC family protein [Dokdonella sp.]HET9034353.1 TolC family protein [Dokdonella sp.]
MNPLPVVFKGLPRGLCRRWPFVFSLILAAWPGIGSAAEPRLSLNQAIAQAIDQAPIIQARDARIVATSEDVARAAALPDPMLVFGVQNLPIAGADAFSLDDEPMTMRRIGVTQVLPSRSKRAARRESALAVQSQAEVTRLASVLEVKRAVASAWIAWWAATREMSLLEELREQSQLAQAAAKARLAGGSGSASDALAARALELALDNRIDDARAAIAQARAGLSRWLVDDVPIKPAAAPDFSQLPRAQSELLDRLDQQGPLLVWDAREASADAALAMANAEKRSDWSISTGFARRGGDASNVIWLEVGVGLPLFSANRQDRGINARRSDLQSIRSAREDARRAQEESVRGTLARWSAQGRKAVRFRDSILPLDHDRSATALAAHSGGAGLRDWLDAQRDEISARIDYARLLADWGQSWAELAFLLPDEAAR